MINICNMKDLETLKESKGSKNLHEYMTEYFKSLHENLGSGESLNDFDLDEHGHIIILESSEDEDKLESIGLEKDDGGLLNATFEYMDIITMPDDSQYFKTLILANNELGYPIFVSKSSCSKELHDYMMEYIL